MWSIIKKEWSPPFDDHPILSSEEKETHAFWDPHQFPIFTSKRHRFLKYLESNAIDVPHWIRNISRIQLCVESFEFSGQSIWQVVSPKFKWISRNYWEEEYWVSEKGICEWESRENKIQKIHILKNCKMIIKILNYFWESSSKKKKKNNLDNIELNANLNYKIISRSVFRKSEF